MNFWEINILPLIKIETFVIKWMFYFAVFKSFNRLTTRSISKFVCDIYDFHKYHNWYNLYIIFNFIISVQFQDLGLYRPRGRGSRRVSPGEPRFHLPRGLCPVSNRIAFLADVGDPAQRRPALRLRHFPRQWKCVSQPREDNTEGTNPSFVISGVCDCSSQNEIWG